MFKEAHPLAGLIPWLVTGSLPCLSPSSQLTCSSASSSLSCNCIKSKQSCCRKCPWPAGQRTRAKKWVFVYRKNAKIFISFGRSQQILFSDRQPRTKKRKNCNLVIVTVAAFFRERIDDGFSGRKNIRSCCFRFNYDCGRRIFIFSRWTRTIATFSLIASSAALGRSASTAQQYRDGFTLASNGKAGKTLQNPPFFMLWTFRIGSN